MSYLSWHVGMKVVCVDVDDFAIKNAPTEPLVKGEVYTISAMDPDRFGELAIQVAERPATYIKYGMEYEGWYKASRFRPVQKRKTDISIFTAMLHDKKERVDA